MKKKSSGIISLLVIVSQLCVGVAFVYAQSLSEVVGDHRKKLEEELQGLEQEIYGFQLLINEKRNEAGSLERDIAILDAKIDKTKLQIRAIDVSVQSLQGKIVTKEENIDAIVAKIDREKLSLAEALRTLNELDNTSLIEVLLTYNRLSDFLGSAESIDVVQKSLQDSFDILRSSKIDEEREKEDLIERKKEAGELRALQVIEQRQLEADEKERQTILKATRGKESEYANFQAAKKRDAASIRTQLFLLQGSPAIPFEKAVEYAELASSKTGVRVAFILGIIAQESELGKNIGQCNLPDDPPKYKWQQIMKPSRDHAPYLDITSRLGLDPNLMPLSCPLSVGYGGAMGPAQFIPSTWITFEAKIAAATGHKPPNPWDPGDAFMASAIFLSELGASSVAGEREAAARYFAGGNWKSYLGTTYANQVLAKADTFQEQFNIIRGVALR